MHEHTLNPEHTTALTPLTLESINAALEAIDASPPIVAVVEPGYIYLLTVGYNGINYLFIYSVVKLSQEGMQKMMDTWTGSIQFVNSIAELYSAIGANRLADDDSY